jgi:ribosomal protein S18 acetylase RimI-like enzyme
MPPLSNSTRSGDVIEARLARSSELEAAVAILLAGTEDRASAEQVQAFLSMASQRGLSLEDLWVATRAGRIEWAMLPVVSPGRTMLLLSPPSLPRNLSNEPIAAVVDSACDFHQKNGVHLAQLLLDPAASTLRQAYVRRGFLELAELIYLQREVKKVPSTPPLSKSIEIQNYSASTHDLFQHTIARSYEHSLDCPGLSGMRDMEDVVAGHKGPGEFDPSLWFLLMEDREPQGVLLLGTALHADALELVYLGLVPKARGRGLGDALMNLALLSVFRQNRHELTLAVDSRNTPAMDLYFRHGLRRIGARAALVRQLGAGDHKPPAERGLTEGE